MNSSILDITYSHTIKAVQYNGKNWGQVRSFAARYASCEVERIPHPKVPLTACNHRGKFFINVNDYVVTCGRWDLEAYSPDEFARTFTGTATQQDEPLMVEVNNHRLVISIGVETLRKSVESGRLDPSLGVPSAVVEVSNADMLAHELLYPLLSEEADGSTPVHLLLDAMALRSLEDGGTALDISVELDEE